MIRIRCLLALLALLAAFASSAVTVVYDDLGYTIRTTGESTCLLDVTGHTGVTLQEHSASPVGATSMFDFRFFSEMASAETNVYFGPLGLLLLFK